MAKEYVRKKPIVSGTVSPVHKKKIDKLVEKGEFASISDLLSQAVTEFLNKYETPSNEIPQISQNKLTKADLDFIKNIIHEQIEEMKFDRKTK